MTGPVPAPPPPPPPPVCPTPTKHAARDIHAAARWARHASRVVLGLGRRFEPCYGYLCRCGSWHITRRDSDPVTGKPLDLLYEIDDRLQAFALERPHADVDD